MFQTSKSGAVDVIEVDTTLNGETREQLSSALAQNASGGRPMAVIDLTEMQLIDSLGIEEILEQHESFVDRGGNLKLAGASAMCADVLRITGVLERIELYDDTKEAIASFLK